jgi:hypothetical protein
MTESDPPIVQEFSLTVGGPFYQMLARLHLWKPEPNIAVRVSVLVLLTWAPLLGLCVLEGTAFGGKIQLPLLHDFSIWGRLLVALPLLIIAEIVIDPWIRRAIRTFVSSGIVREEDVPAFHLALTRIKRLRDSGLAEFALVLLAAVPLFLVFDYEWASNGVSEWHGSTTRGLSPAGWWFACVSSPIYRFIFFRWLWRYALWSALLYKIMKLNLNLRPAHPDTLGGMGFVLSTQQQFGILFAAFSAALAGQFSTAILHFGMPLKDTRVPMVLFVLIAVLIVLGPLTILTPTLIETRRTGLARYSQAARRLISSFESKWIDGPAAAREVMLGNQDPSSLIDFISSYNVVRGMQIIPVSRQLVTHVAAQAAAPFLLVWLFATPLDEIVLRLLRVVI